MVCGAVAGAGCVVCMGTRVARCAIDAMPAGEDVGYMGRSLDSGADKIAGREYTCDPNDTHNVPNKVVDT
jgi:hypothetical protein